MRATVLATIAALTFVAALASGQEADTARAATLVTGRPAFGGYLGLDTRITRVKGATGVFTGGEIALLIDRRLAVGLEGFALATDDARVDTGTGTSRRISMAYRGLRVGYVALRVG